MQNNVDLKLAHLTVNIIVNSGAGKDYYKVFRKPANPFNEQVLCRHVRWEDDRL